jgi:predicted nucleic acid-binding protein
MIVVDTMVYADALLGVERFRDGALEVFDGTETVLVPDTL